MKIVSSRHARKELIDALVLSVENEIKEGVAALVKTYCQVTGTKPAAAPKPVRPFPRSSEKAEKVKKPKPLQRRRKVQPNSPKAQRLAKVFARTLSAPAKTATKTKAGTAGTGDTMSELQAAIRQELGLLGVPVPS